MKCMYNKKNDIPVGWEIESIIANISYVQFYLHHDFIQQHSGVCRVMEKPLLVQIFVLDLARQNSNSYFHFHGI